jgi:hypothetical protein
MKFHVTVEDQSGDIVLDQPTSTGRFIGLVLAAGHAPGQIDGTVVGNSYSGTIVIDGIKAKFQATIEGGAITGMISLGIFYHKKFAGVLAA